MRIDAIKEDVTYGNKKGLQRTVKRLEGVTSTSFFVIYTKPNSDKEHKCWCTSFADWAKEVVDTPSEINS